MAKKRFKVLYLFSGIFLVALAGFGILAYMLYSSFKIGELVYKPERMGEFGKIEALNPIQLGYMVEWESGEYTSEFLFNLRKISELEHYEIAELSGDYSNKDLPSFDEESEFYNYDIKNIDGQNIISIDSLGSISFIGKENCDAEFLCSDWGRCYYDYDIDILASGGSSAIQFRYCKDKNSCMPDIVDSRGCDDTKNITLEIENRCEENQIVIQDSEERVLSRLADKNKSYYMDVLINFVGDSYCEHCYNHLVDGDENGIDCGGSCRRC